MMLGQLQAQNANLLKDIIAGLGQKTTGNMVDSRGIGKPPVFKGEESKYVEWMAKLDSYIRVNHMDGYEWLKKICNNGEPVTVGEVKAL